MIIISKVWHGIMRNFSLFIQIFQFFVLFELTQFAPRLVRCGQCQMGVKMVAFKSSCLVEFLIVSVLLLTFVMLITCPFEALIG